MGNADSEAFSKLMHAFSHDLKNILHNIHGYAQLLEDENEPDYIKKIETLVMKCKDVINEYVEAVDLGDLTFHFKSQK